MTTLSTASKDTFLGHPKGLFILFFTELWERFSFYGIRALLVLFLSDKLRGGFGWSEVSALQLYGYYGMAVYCLGVPGGILADRYLGDRAAVLWGGVFQCIGHFLLALGTEPAFITGLVSIAIGTGLLKPNISTMVGDLYQEGDPKRDHGFSIFYIGINIGAVLAPVIIGAIGEIYGWHYGFSLAGVGVLAGMFTFWWGSDSLGTVGTKPSAATTVAAQSLQSTKMSTQDRDRILVLLISFVAVFVFFIAFEQAGGLMNLYTAKYIDRTVWGWTIPTSLFQSINPAVIIIFGPLSPIVWNWAARGGKPVNSIIKMGIGNLLVGAGFLLMIGANWHLMANPGVKVPLYWLVGSYWLQTLGEFCVVPVALSLITKVAPQHMRSSMMGLFFFTVGMSSWAASMLGSQTEALGASTVFGLIVAVTFSSGLPFILFNKSLIALSHGSAEDKQ